MTRRRIPAAVAALLLTAAVAGCGGTDGEDATSSSSGAATTGQQPAPGGARPSQDALEGFAACLRENGVDVPDEAPAEGAQPPFDPQDPAVRQAFQACQGELPDGALPGGAEPR